jgi:hypothetical protein
MANLTWAELKKYGGVRIDKLVSEIELGNALTMVDGSKKVLTHVHGKRGLDELKNKGEIAAKFAYEGKVLKDTKGNLYETSKLQKTADFGGAGQNKGNIAEGVFAVAIAARFINKGKKITPQDAYAVRSKLYGSGMIRKAEFSSPNKLASVKDKVDVLVELNEADMKNFLNNDYPELLNPAVIFANSVNVRNLADTLYENNQANHIEVKSLGISGGLRTKIDTAVLVDGLQVMMNYSLKAGDVKQFGQFAGHKVEAQENLWGAFGISIPSQTKADFQKHAGNHDFPKAAREMFKKAAEVFNRNPDSTQVAKAIVFFATQPDTIEVDLVQLKKNKVVVYRFSQAVELIKGVKLKAVVTAGTSNLPTLTFITDDNLQQKLVSVRVKSSGQTAGENYYRSVVEKQKYMTDLLAETLM